MMNGVLIVEVSPAGLDDVVQDMNPQLQSRSIYT